MLQDTYEINGYMHVVFSVQEVYRGGAGGQAEVPGLLSDPAYPCGPQQFSPLSPGHSLVCTGAQCHPGESRTVQGRQLSTKCKQHELCILYLLDHVATSKLNTFLAIFKLMTDKSLKQFSGRLYFLSWR